MEDVIWIIIIYMEVEDIVKVMGIKKSIYEGMNEIMWKKIIKRDMKEIINIGEIREEYEKESAKSFYKKYYEWNVIKRIKCKEREDKELNKKTSEKYGNKNKFLECYLKGHKNILEKEKDYYGIINCMKLYKKYYENKELGKNIHNYKSWSIFEKLLINMGPKCLTILFYKYKIFINTVKQMIKYNNFDKKYTKLKYDTTIHHIFFSNPTLAFFVFDINNNFNDYLYENTSYIVPLIDFIYKIKISCTLYPSLDFCHDIISYNTKNLIKFCDLNKLGIQDLNNIKPSNNNILNKILEYYNSISLCTIYQDI